MLLERLKIAVFQAQTFTNQSYQFLPEYLTAMVEGFRSHLLPSPCSRRPDKVCSVTGSTGEWHSIPPDPPNPKCSTESLAAKQGRKTPNNYEMQYSKYSNKHQCSTKHSDISFIADHNSVPKVQRTKLMPLERNNPKIMSLERNN